VTTESSLAPAGRPRAGSTTRRRPLERIRAVRLDAWTLAFAGTTAVALILRLAELGAKPLHHDESLHAWFAWLLVSGEGYEYDPVYHGPVQIYLTSLAYMVLGVGDAAARVAPALVGAATVLLPLFLRRQLGNVAALSASVALCLSPSFLYFSRFAREDAYVAFVDMLLIVLVLRFLYEPRRWHPAAILGSLALAFATKETTYITVFVFGTFFLALAARQLLAARRAHRPLREAAILTTLASVGRDAWLWGGASFLAVYTVLFTTFLTNPQGLRDGLYGSIEYWLSQQEVNRGDQPWFYYLAVLPAYEWLVLALGAVGAVVAVRRLGTTGALLVWGFLGQLVVYSWASERMPWLILHSLLPLALLAGIGVGAMWDARSRIWGRVGLAAAAVGAAASCLVAFGLSYQRAADPRELLVYVQTSDDVQDVRRTIAAVDRDLRRREGRRVRIAVDGWGGATWPWAWYLRDLPVAYPDFSFAGTGPGDADIVLVAEPNHERLAPRLVGFTGRRFHLREWWVPDYAASPSDWARWLATREPWGPLGYLDERIYVRDALTAPS
jgi:uncharacterized protein (TIGR03663 family)